MLAWLALPVACVAPEAPPPRPRPAALEIAWKAPQACPDENALRERVLELAELDEDGQGTLLVDGAIEASDGAFELRLRTRLGDLEDERSLRDPDCGALVEAAALLVSVSVDPSSEASPQTPEAVPAPERLPEGVRSGEGSPDPEQGSPQTSPAPATNRTSRGRPRAGVPTTRSEVTWRPDAAFVGAASQVEFGALPGLSGGPRLSLGVQWARVTVAAYGLYGAPRRTDVVLGASGLAQFGAAGVIGCGNPLSGDLGLPLCAVVEGGGVRVASRGLDPSNRVLSPWTAAGARVGLERRWGHVGAYSAAEVLVPVVRTDVLLGEASSFTTWAVSLRLVLGVKIFFATEST